MRWSSHEVTYVGMPAHTLSCRQGTGRHHALKRVQSLCPRQGFVLGAHLRALSPSTGPRAGASAGEGCQVPQAK